MEARCRGRHLDDAARAGFDALAAAGALIGVDHRQPVVGDDDGAERTDIAARAEAETAVGAELVAAAYELGGAAVEDAFVVRLAFRRLVAASAEDDRHVLGDVTDLHTEDLSDTGSGLLPAGRAVRDVCLTLDHGVGEAGAAGVATGAAIGVRQLLGHLLDSRVDLHGEVLGGQHEPDTQDQAESSDGYNSIENDHVTVP